MLNATALFLKCNCFCSETILIVITMYLCMDYMHSHCTFHIIIYPLIKGVIISMLDVYCSPIKFPKAFYDDFIFFLHPQSNCSHILTWLFALLFFHLFSCTYFIASAQNFLALVLPLPQFHYPQLVICFIKYCAKLQPFLPPTFPPFLLIMIFTLALSEIGFIAGNIY